MQLAKLRALTRERSLGDQPEVLTFPEGAALAAGTSLWVLVGGDGSRAVGPVLALAAKVGASDVHLLADDVGVAARRAALLAADLTVWQVNGAELEQAEAAELEPEPQVDPAVVSNAAELAAAGADVVIEHGQVIGEVEGLEMARVVRDGDTIRLAVGVGRHDRDAFTMVHGHDGAAVELAEIVRRVRQSRQLGRAHPLGRLARSRRLRFWASEAPERVGLEQLEPVPSTLARRTLLDDEPAFALGADASGRRVVVGFSAGIHLDLVPAAVDVRAHRQPDAQLVLVVPERDDHRVTRQMAELALPPASIRTVPLGWEAGSS